MTSYTDRFGGSTVQPSDVGFRAVALSASITTVWPSFATAANECARIMKVSASAGSLTITLPDATLAATGQDVLFDNSGAETFTVLDSVGGSVCTLTAGQVKYLYLSDSSTAAGTWRVTLFGASSSNLDASQLAGYGLKAISNTINAAPAMTSVSGDTTVTSVDRAKIFLWEGGSGTLTLPTTVGSTSDFHIEVRNQGSGTVTVQPVGGVLIDGSANIELSVNESCFVHMGVTDWSTVGRGRNTAFNFTRLSKVVDGGTDTLSLTEASSVVQTYTGALLSNQVIEVPAVVQVYYISNGTTGSYTLGFKCVTGGSATVTVLQGQAAILFCDGSTVINANTSVSGITTIVFGAGSAAVPSVAIANAATGFYASGTNEIGVSLNGVYVGKFAAGGLTLDGLTASSAVATDASKKLVSVTNTGTGNNVLATSPTLVTPVLGVAAATTINKVTLTAPATGSTLTIADGKTLTASNSVTLTAADGSTLAIGTGGTLGTAAYTAATAYQPADADLTTWAGVTPGTGVATALAVNVGSAGSVVVNGASNNVGIGNATPLALLHVGSGASLATRELVYIGGTVNPTAFGSQVSVRAGTINAATNQNASIFFADGTIVANTSGTHSVFSTMRFQPPTITAGGATITEAATFYVGGAPTGATNNYAVHVSSGASLFGGNVTFAGTLTAGVAGSTTGAVYLAGFTSGTANIATDATASKITSSVPFEVTGALSATGGINSTAIGQTTPAAGSFTTLGASGAITGGNQIVSTAKGFTTNQVGSDSITTGNEAAYWFNQGAGATGAFLANTSNGIDVYVNPSVWTKSASFTSTGLNSTAIGQTTPAAGSFTTLGASGITSVTDTTDATSTTAASLKTAGGLAVAKKAYFGDAITVGSGLIGNSTPINGGIFTTKSSATIAPNNTATTLFTLPTTGFGTFLVSIGWNGVNDPTNYSCVAIFCTDGANAVKTDLRTSSGMFLTLSGMDVQGRHTVGAELNVSWAVIRIS